MAIEEKLINRINELARLKKERSLTEEEEKEQKQLREKYIEAFRTNLKSTLNNIDIVDKVEIEGTSLSIVQSKLSKISGIKDISEEEGKVLVTYLCKEITEDEILKKI